MASFSLSVVTPEKVFFDGETTQIIVRTADGDIGILANHTSLVADLPSGPLKVRQADGNWRTAAISTGLLKVGGNKVSILANAVEWADEIDVEWAKRSEEDARRRLKELQDKHELDLAELKLSRALNRISVSSMK
ncbi:MAG: ATP synthase F1 subunit epsilon [Ruminococcus sp.]|nr:ATP synthase F1 subunit epsilon [Ruminococcus sp.]MCM1381254.1 ATP synthase F1 subunit epsilon [Muribaculaceae bacterium]MCM1478639.1 ATP synthase F1 subunit epsilon [Muribaculaceae bacterium]